MSRFSVKEEDRHLCDGVGNNSSSLMQYMDLTASPDGAVTPSEKAIAFSEPPASTLLQKLLADLSAIRERERKRSYSQSKIGINSSLNHIV